MLTRGKKNFSFKWMDILLTMEPVAPDQCPNPSLSIKEIDFSHLLCIFFSSLMASMDVNNRPGSDGISI